MDTVKMIALLQDSLAKYGNLNVIGQVEKIEELEEYEDKFDDSTNRLSSIPGCTECVRVVAYDNRVEIQLFL